MYGLAASCGVLSCPDAVAAAVAVVAAEVRAPAATAVPGSRRPAARAPAATSGRARPPRKPGRSRAADVARRAVAGAAGSAGRAMGSLHLGAVERCRPELHEQPGRGRRLLARPAGGRPGAPVEGAECRE